MWAECQKSFGALVLTACRDVKNELSETFWYPFLSIDYIITRGLYDIRCNLQYYLHWSGGKKNLPVLLLTDVMKMVVIPTAQIQLQTLTTSSLEISAYIYRMSLHYSTFIERTVKFKCSLWSDWFEVAHSRAFLPTTGWIAELHRCFSKTWMDIDTDSALLQIVCIKVIW